MNGESSIHRYAPACVKWTAGEKLRVTQGTQSGPVTTWRDETGRGYMCNYGWFASYDRNQHNIIKGKNKE